MRQPGAGDLKKRVELYKWRETPAQTGELDTDWDLIGAFWAKVEVVGSQQFWGTAQIEETVTHRVWLRYVPALIDQLMITGRTQMKYKGCIFRIKRVTDFEEQHKWLILEVEQLGFADAD